MGMNVLRLEMKSGHWVYCANKPNVSTDDSDPESVLYSMLWLAQYTQWPDFISNLSTFIPMGQGNVHAIAVGFDLPKYTHHRILHQVRSWEYKFGTEYSTPHITLAYFATAEDRDRVLAVLNEPSDNRPDISSWRVMMTAPEVAFT